MEETKHIFFKEVKQLFIDLDFTFINLVGCYDYPCDEDKIHNPTIYISEMGQPDNGINGQFEVETIGISCYCNTGDFFEETICDLFKSKHPTYEVQDGYGSIWVPGDYIKIFNVYGDSDLMDDRIGFYDIGITPLTIMYLEDKKIFIESADLIYDYYDKEFRWVNHIKFPVNFPIINIMKELGVGKRAYFRKEDYFSFRTCDAEAFENRGLKVNDNYTHVIISIN